MVGLKAALDWAPGVALGNVVGSNIANILLILGMSALLYPMATTKEAFRRDGAVLVVPTLCLIGAMLVGTIGRGSGLIFLALLAAHTVYTYFTERTHGGAVAAAHVAQAEEAAPRAMSMPLGLAITFGGIAAIVYGASLLIESAVVIARSAGLSEAVIGLTLSPSASRCRSWSPRSWRPSAAAPTSPSATWSAATSSTPGASPA